MEQLSGQSRIGKALLRGAERSSLSSGKRGVGVGVGSPGAEGA